MMTADKTIKMKEQL